MDAGQFFISVGIKAEEALKHLRELDKLLKEIKKNAQIAIGFGEGGAGGPGIPRAKTLHDRFTSQQSKEDFQRLKERMAEEKKLLEEKAKQSATIRASFAKESKRAFTDKEAGKRKFEAGRKRFISGLNRANKIAELQKAKEALSNVRKQKAFEAGRKRFVSGLNRANKTAESQKAREALANIRKQKAFDVGRKRFVSGWNKEQKEKKKLRIEEQKKQLKELADIKLSDRTPKTLSTIQTGLKNITALSIEAKAALIATVYALNNFFAKSINKGATLTNIGALLSGDTQMLQKYQYLAQQKNVSREEIAQNFLAIKDMMLQGEMTGQFPQGWKLLQNATQIPFTETDRKAFARAPELFIERLQHLASQKTIDEDRRHHILSSLVTPGMRALLMQDTFSQANINAIPRGKISSEERVKELSAIKAEVESIRIEFEQMWEGLVVTFGRDFIKQIKDIVPEISALTKAFADLIKETQALKGLGMIFEGWAGIFRLIKEYVEWIGIKTTGTDAEKGKLNSDQEQRNEDYHRLWKLERDEKHNRIRKYLQGPGLPADFFAPNGGYDPNFSPSKKHITPYVPDRNSNTQSSAKVFNFNQTFSIGKDSGNASEIALQIEKQFTRALKSLPLEVMS